MEAELVKMSPKGQLVVPQTIREQEVFRAGDRFMSFAVKEGVLFKKIELPNAKEEFEKVSKSIASHLKKRNVKESDVNEAIAWARKK